MADGGDSDLDEDTFWLEQQLDESSANQCCEICHCDCYTRHYYTAGNRAESISRLSDAYNIAAVPTTSKTKSEKYPSQLVNCSQINRYRAPAATAATAGISRVRKVRPKPNIKPTKPLRSKAVKEKRCCSELRTRPSDEHNKPKKRSKSMCSARSYSRCTERRYTRDCEILRDLLLNSTADNSDRLKSLAIDGHCTTRNLAKDALDSIGKLVTSSPSLSPSLSPSPPASPSHSHSHQQQQQQQQHRMPESLLMPATNMCCSKQHTSSITPIRLSESMANLCLMPTVRQAYLKVPVHDKRILNRMASKRREQALAKENAWLARKYWENERYERELFKCEQMEEYQKAVRDKQFQDYLQTKARLNAIAQRDRNELQRLKASIHQKETRTKKRLQTLRNERDLLANQRRCDELRKNEAVIVQQEGHHLDDVLRKTEICQRLSERLQRADQIRHQMLTNYLKRLRHDNQIEQIHHEQHWHQVQSNELQKREQLKERISRKRYRSQRFIDDRQQRLDAIRKNAKLSQSLRELVRASVSPDVGPNFNTNSMLIQASSTAGTTMTTYCPKYTLDDLLMHTADI